MFKDADFVTQFGCMQMITSKLMEVFSPSWNPFRNRIGRATMLYFPDVHRLTEAVIVNKDIKVSSAQCVLEFWDDSRSKGVIILNLRPMRNLDKAERAELIDHFIFGADGKYSNFALRLISNLTKKERALLEAEVERRRQRIAAEKSAKPKN